VRISSLMVGNPIVAGYTKHHSRLEHQFAMDTSETFVKTEGREGEKLHPPGAWLTMYTSTSPNHSSRNSQRSPASGPEMHRSFQDFVH